MVLLDKNVPAVCQEPYVRGGVGSGERAHELHGHTRGPAGSQDGAGERGGAELSVGWCLKVLFT